MPSLLPRKQILFESDVVEQARALRIDDAGTEICLRDSAGQEQALPTEVKAIVLQVLESLQTKTAVNLKPLNKSLTSPNLSKMTAAQAYRSQTVVTGIMGCTAMLFIWLLGLVIV